MATYQLKGDCMQSWPKYGGDEVKSTVSPHKLLFFFSEYVPIPDYHRPVSSQAIAGFPAILPPPENTGIFVSARTCQHFFPAQICRHFITIRHCRHFFSDPKLPAYFPTWKYWHIFQHEIAGIFSDLILLAFFRPEIGASKSSSFLLLQSNDQGL